VTVDEQFLQARIAATQAQIVAYEDALLALNGGMQSYTIDTGQGRQTVTRASISEINRTLDALIDRLDTYETRLNRNGGAIARPAW